VTEHRILEAFYFDGLSVKEIADEMAVSERAVGGWSSTGGTPRRS